MQLVESVASLLRIIRLKGSVEGPKREACMQLDDWIDTQE